MSGNQTVFNAIKGQDWNQVLLALNGLSMQDMLSTLAQLSTPNLGALIAKTQWCWAPVNMPRIAFAIQVVKSRAIPQQVPDDLGTTGQVQVARSFLLRHPSTGRVSLAPTTRSGQKFASLNLAAIAAPGEILPLSAANNWEYAGRLLDSGGMFTFSKP